VSGWWNGWLAVEGEDKDIDGAALKYTVLQVGMSAALILQLNPHSAIWVEHRVLKQWEIIDRVAMHTGKETVNGLRNKKRQFSSRIHKKSQIFSSQL